MSTPGAAVVLTDSINRISIDPVSANTMPYVRHWTLNGFGYHGTSGHLQSSKVLALLAVLALASCGGGGGGSVSPTAVAIVAPTSIPTTIPTAVPTAAPTALATPPQPQFDAVAGAYAGTVTSGAQHGALLVRVTETHTAAGTGLTMTFGATFSSVIVLSGFADPVTLVGNTLTGTMTDATCSYALAATVSNLGAQTAMTGTYSSVAPCAPSSGTFTAAKGAST